jgi:hypothetical protein
LPISSDVTSAEDVVKTIMRSGFSKQDLKQIQTALAVKLGQPKEDTRTIQTRSILRVNLPGSKYHGARGMLIESNRKTIRIALTDPMTDSAGKYIDTLVGERLMFELC